MEQFRKDADCRVFLSTDAGGVGLNLQAASAVINFEPPWNPARLEQRIGRVHRMGQAHPVHVVHLLTEGSIEERVWETLKLKKSLFAGVFDSPTDEVSFAALGKKSVLQSVKEIFANQPGRPKPVIEEPPSHTVPVQDVATAMQEQPATPAAAPFAAADGLIESGVRFLESLAKVAQSGLTGEGLVSRDPKTNRPVLSIPLPESLDQERVMRAIAALASAFGPKA
jgi:hypothetical protein